jgi:hypothetical protein
VTDAEMRARFMAVLSRLREWFVEPVPLPWTPVAVLGAGKEEEDDP